MGDALCRRPPTIAHCARIADSWDCCKRILELLVPKPVIGMLDGLTLASWGTLGRSWDIGEQEEGYGYFEVQAWMFIDFCWIQGTHVERFFGTLD